MNTIQRNNGLFININCRKVWYQDGAWHRLNGPAVEYKDEYKAWYQDSLLHRLDGPAREWVSGMCEYYYKGQYIECTTQEEFERIIKLRLLW